jgi:putative transcriptional regulator
MGLMDTRLFERLASSLREMDQIVRSERRPSREFRIDAVDVQEIRKSTGLSQANFARIIHVQLGTLKNWEQGRRDPTGPAKALLHVIRKDPVRALKALSEVD